MGLGLVGHNHSGENIENDAGGEAEHGEGDEGQTDKGGVQTEIVCQTAAHTADLAVSRRAIQTLLGIVLLSFMEKRSFPRLELC